jgi:hypothetical protein
MTKVTLSTIAKKKGRKYNNSNVATVVNYGVSSFSILIISH